MSLLGLPARVVMLVLIFLTSIAGVCTPFAINQYGRGNMLTSRAFDTVQCFAVGLICGVAVLHIFADAQEDLSEVSEFPVAGTFMLAGCFMMLAINRVSTLIASRHSPPDDGSPSHSQHPHDPLDHGNTGAAGTGSFPRPMSDKVSGSFHGHVHQRLLMDPALGSSVAVRIKAYLLELAIAVHSVLVGLSVGIIDDSASTEASVEVVTLGVAVCFHQLFEGIAVGSQGVRVGFNKQAGIFMVVLFALSCPAGGALGIAISSSLDTESDHAHWVLGILNAFASGTLIEIGLVDLLPELFSHKHGKDEKVSLRAEFSRLLALVSGAAVMAVLAIWA